MRAKLPHVGKSVEGPTWGAAAFLVESMLLLVFLAAATALFFQLFGLSLARAAEGEDLSRAVVAASSAAERFAADPSQAEGELMVEGMLVDCDVSEEPTGEGVLYSAVIKVYAPEATRGGSAEAESCYTVSATRYVSGVTR